ncbi:MAG TPA: DUF1800 family protein, partial [Terracidiphilus sp.]|nr:DUF1800 family protein [Terracidiphilus sp.]
MRERMQVKRIVACLVLALAASLMLGCSGVTVTDPSYFAAIKSAANSLRVNQTMQIENNSAITKVSLAFYVNGIQGGNAQVGTIDATGLYTAPAVVPVPNTVTITSVATGHSNYPNGSLTLAVLNPIPIIDTVTPTTLTEGSALVSVTGSQFVYGATILWNGVAVPTTYISSTQLAATIDAPNPGTFPLTVTNPDPGSATAQTVPVLVQAGVVSLKLDTSGGTTVRVRNSIMFSLTVMGTNNTAVNVLVNGIAGGNAQIGTASANTTGTITYTAPAVVPTPSNVVQLTLVSVDSPSVSLSQNIAVLNPIPILTAATPDAFSVGTSSVVLTGRDFISGARLLVNGSAVPTTFNSGTQLTATISPTQAGTLDLQVLNPDPGAATSADLIATVGGTVPTPPVSVNDAARFLDQATFGATEQDVRHLSTIGYQAWFNEQFATQQTLLEPGVEQALILNNPACAGGDVTCNSKLFVQNLDGQNYVENGFWQQSLTAPDQLRQRVAYSLHEMLVISMASTGVESMPRGAAHYYDVLGADAFVNFRQLLEDVTLNPMMGQWLAMQGNDKGNDNTDPDENYAREVMQLFTIGLWQLNDDGS